MYALMIAEKPSVAQKIAQSLADGEAERFEDNGVRYYRFDKNGREYVVVSAVGHLYGLKQKIKGWKYPVFDIDWVPAADISKGSEFSRKYLETIVELAKDADDYYISTDYDIEGELIAHNILKFACKPGALKKAKRMHFSALTKDELIESYEKAVLPDFALAEAGEARHILDWLWGINLSRALSLSLKKASNRFVILSTGRVQGPTLSILTQREREILAFKPEPYWQIELVFGDGKNLYRAMHEKGDFKDRKEAERAYRKADVGAAKVSDVKKREYQQAAPHPFDLTTLLTEAHRCFGYEPKYTQQLAQKLYEGGYISYPRTASQKLPGKIDYRKIMEKLQEYSPTYARLSKKLLAEKELKPNEGKNDDPAHPALHPTGELPRKLQEPHAKLYDMVSKRFFATFGKPAVREGITLKLDANGEIFVATGARTKEKNWHEFYAPYVDLKEEELPECSIGETVKINELSLLDKETQPPSRYSGASIIKKMEKEGLGTKATRADILATLFSRNYASGKSIEVSTLGMSVVGALEKYCPEVISVELTRKFDRAVEDIQAKKNGKGGIVDEAQKDLTQILSKFAECEQQIGDVLKDAFIETKKAQKVVGECPACKGTLKIIVSRRTGKRFIGCGSYPKCKNAFPLPQEGEIRMMKTNCKVCSHPMMSVFRKGKRPYRMCILHTCTSKRPKDEQKAKEWDEKIAKMVEAQARYAKEQASVTAQATHAKQPEGEKTASVVAKAPTAKKAAKAEARVKKAVAKGASTKKTDLVQDAPKKTKARAKALEVAAEVPKAVKKRPAE